MHSWVSMPPDIEHLTTHEVRRDDVPWTADVLGVPRALWSRALTEASGPRLTGELKDPIEIIRHLACSLDVSRYTT